MKSGKVVLVETKGDDRDNSDSILKLFLGLSWAGRAGSEYAYMMVFENNPLPNAWAFGKFIDLVRRM